MVTPNANLASSTIITDAKTFRQIDHFSWFSLRGPAMISGAMPAPFIRRRADLVVFGEFFVDLVFYNLPTAPRMGEEVKTEQLEVLPGGGLATTSIIASRLGTPTSVVARVGIDAENNPAWQKLVRSGVCVDCCEFSKKHPTAMTVCAAFDGERMMITHDVVNKRLHTLLTRTTVRRHLRRARHLHLACSVRPPQLWAPTIRELRSQGLTISTDIGWNPDVLRSPKLPSLLRECDFTFPNELEAREMTGEKFVEKAARKLAQWVRVAVVKLGRDGCIAVSEGKVTRTKSIPVRDVDATGAGDAFNGGFLHGYLSGWPIEDCLRCGVVCGAMATTRPGGSSAIPSQAKLRQLMHQV